jgi:hypothetical protein
MPDQLSVAGITGKDGVAPVYQPNARWTTWSIKEIYTGQQGANRYVPNVDDYVIDPDTNIMRVVLSIDPTTLVPTLGLVKHIDSGEFTEDDKLLGAGPGLPSYTFRVYIDKSVMPHTLAVDERLKIVGSGATKARIYKGSVVLGTEKVISAFYDQSGVLLGQDIPLVLAAINQVDNKTIKTVPVCYTTEDLPDGEVVTLIAFSDDGHVVSKRELMVENTGFIRSTALGTKYVRSISVESPFLSKSDPNLIQYPINVPLAGLNLMGVVEYSDGSKLKQPVDGTKFSMFGWEGYISTIVGQKFPLVLRYNLSPDEIAYGGTVDEGKFLTKPMKATTLKAEGAYSVKLFGYPVWIDAINGYRMEWFLYNLERNIVYPVTPFVKMTDASHVFDPTAYGVHQHLVVSINLNDVNGSYKSYTHVQTIDVVLAAQGSARSTNWTVAFDPGQVPVFGENNHADTTFVNANYMKARIDLGCATKDAWLERLYLRTRPLVDRDHELVPPMPDFFSITAGGHDVVFPVSQWNSDLVLDAALPNNSTMFVKFFKRTADGDMQLAVAGLPVYQQN